MTPAPATTTAKTTSASLYRAVVRGEMSPSEAGEKFQEVTAPKKLPPRRTLPSILWSLLVIVAGTLFLPLDRRN